MSNPISSYINNTIGAAEDNYHASQRYQSNKETIENLTEKSKKQKLTDREQENLKNAKAEKPKSEQNVSDTRGKFFGALLQNRTYVDRKTGKAKGD